MIFDGVNGRRRRRRRRHALTAVLLTGRRVGHGRMRRHGSGPVATHQSGCQYGWQTLRLLLHAGIHVRHVLTH